MVAEKNIEAIYNQARLDKRGKVWEAVLSIRSGVEQKIKANLEATGEDPDVTVALAARKKSNPEMSEELLKRQALIDAVEAQTKKEFASKLSGEVEKGAGMAGLSNLLDLGGKFMSLINGGISEKLAVIKSGFFDQIRDAWNEYRSPDNKKGLIEVFSEYTRNANVANAFGITDKDEQKRLLVALTNNNPVVPEVKPIVLAAAPAAQKTPEQLTAEQLAAQERERAAKQAKDGKPVARHNPPAGGVVPAAQVGTPQGKIADKGQQPSDKQAVRS